MIWQKALAGKLSKTRHARKTEKLTKPRGGKRAGAGRPAFSGKFLVWVWTSVRREMLESSLDRFKSRISSRRRLRELRRENRGAFDADEFDDDPAGEKLKGRLSEEDGDAAERRLEVAEAWRDGLEGQELFQKVGSAMGIDGVFVEGAAIPAPTSIEMASIFRKVARRGNSGTSKWSHCTPAIVKRVWHRAIASQREAEAFLKEEPVAKCLKKRR